MLGRAVQDLEISSRLPSTAVRRLAARFQYLVSGRRWTLSSVAWTSERLQILEGCRREHSHVEGWPKWG